MLEKNKIIEVKCIQSTYDGYGRCFYNDRLVLVKNMLEDEICKVLILKSTKKVSFAKIDTIIKPSKYRVNSICNISNKCGGCDYQYIDYNHQLEIKRQRVIDCFKQFANLDINLKPVNTTQNIYRYRNKVQIPCKDNAMGFYRKKSNDIIPYDDCYLQTDESNIIYHYIHKQIKLLDLSDILRHVLIKQSLINKEIMIVLIVNDFNNTKLTTLTNNLIKQFNPTSLILNLNTNQTNTILGNKERLIYGKEYIIDNIDDLKFQISSKSFFQINSYLVSSLYNKVLEYALVSSNDIVVDLYCGTGTISMFLAKQSKKVIGVEIVPDAIINAKANALLNNINNIEFICEDASIAITKILHQYKQIDVVVVDPPRKGLTIEGIETITKLKPKRVVYVSCDVSTLARDVLLFNKLGYKLNNIEAFDMFPNTLHVESIALLIKDDN